ncbi:MAG: hypothetical protein WCL27_13450, partial [Betaproteobacteria bacterium]
MNTLKSNSSTIQEAQLMELFRRSRVSILFSFPALLTVAFAHYGSVQLPSIYIWLIGMLMVQSIRLGIAQTNLANPNKLNHHEFWRNFETLCAVAAGCGWGAMLFVLDTGQLDFIFLFKFTALAAALGVTMNALSAVLSIYISFI